MYQYGAKWVGTDIAENQIMQARKMSEELNQKVEYLNVPTEELKLHQSNLLSDTMRPCWS
ncbi:hypothetical protein HGO97_012915 [Faecalicatena sp. AGMB00832]|uniref:Methyltransferase family protein n=1 Tax=Faecalicatena faecalis TaxID=2726362 RepID=A0ABS6D527_9FIRM|nr:hypothetical protein [Faecalicatena faecalis]